MNKKLLENKVTLAAQQLERVKGQIAVFLVLNVKGSIELAEDYAEHSATTEFFSLQEAEEFRNGFIKLGIYHEVYNGEKEFIDRLGTNYLQDLPYACKVVYSATGTGLVRSKSALVPALCNLYQLRYCSNDIYTAAFLENKVHVLNLLEYYGFPVPKYWVYDLNRGWLSGNEPTRDLKLIAKPAYECASTGISEASVAKFDEKYFRHIQMLAERFRQPIIVEAFIEGFEVEVPVFDLDEPFCPMAVGIEEGGQKFMGTSYLTYDKVADDKYQFYSFDFEKPDLAQRLKRIAISTFETLNFTGVLRVDFRVQEDGAFYIMDYNNSPHLTPNHSCAFALLDSGFSYEDMLKLLLYNAIK